MTKYPNRISHCMFSPTRLKSCDLFPAKIKILKIIYTYIIWSIVTILCRVVSFWYTPAIHFGRLVIIWIFLFLISCWCFLLACQTHTPPHLFFLRLLTYTSWRSTTICSNRNLNWNQNSKDYYLLRLSINLEKQLSNIGLQFLPDLGCWYVCRYDILGRSPHQSDMLPFGFLSDFHIHSMIDKWYMLNLEHKRWDIRPED